MEPLALTEMLPLFAVVPQFETSVTVLINEMALPAQGSATTPVSVILKEPVHTSCVRSLVQKQSLLSTQTIQERIHYLLGIL